MTIQINHKNNISKETTSNLVLFTDEKFSISNITSKISKQEFLYLKDLLKTCDLKKNSLVFDISSKKKIILISVKNNLEASDIENLGAEFYGGINHEKKSQYTLNSDTLNSKFENFIGYFLHGLKLKSYEFNIYKSKNYDHLLILYLGYLQLELPIQQKLH